MSTEAAELPRRGSSPSRAGGVLRAYRAERRKLLAQPATRVLALVCSLGPFAFATVLAIQSGLPTDTLLGGWAHSSGFAVSLVVLSFGGYLGFPLLAGVLAGDCFASEDRHGTWKTILTRSRSRAQLFGGKCLALLVLATALLTLIAVSSLAAGLLFSGFRPLVGLGGQQLPALECLWLVALCWLLSLPPLLAFVSIAVLASVASRSGVLGVLTPIVAAVLLQLLALVGPGIWMHSLLASSGFGAWHGLLGDPRFYAPLAIGIGVSLLWVGACLSGGWLILRRRDFAGAPAGRRPRWRAPLLLAAASALAVVALAAAGSLGPASVTAARLQASLGAIFNRLTILQQRELGRRLPHGASLALHPGCRRTSGQGGQGSGDWSCTITIVRAQAGAEPFQTTALAYEVSVKPDGCYRAQAPSSVVGQQRMIDAHGHSVVNPLFTIYGCFDTTDSTGRRATRTTPRHVPKPSAREREAERRTLGEAEREAGPDVMREIRQAEREAQRSAQGGGGQPQEPGGR
jgi:ABC-2 type transport system permease protein